MSEDNPLDDNQSDRGEVINNQPINPNPRPMDRNRPRSIRDIKKDNTASRPQRTAQSPAFADERKFSSRRYKTTGKGKWLAGGGVIIGFVLLFIVIGNVTHSASLEIHTETAEFNPDEPIVLASSEYERSTVTVVATRNLPAESVEEVSVPAEGKITVVNQTQETQSLIANTRFQAPNGVEYITPTAITIPAADADGPGLLEGLRVVANVNGPETNQTVNELLSVPGLVGTDLEGQIVAKAETAFTGGFEGERPVAATDDLEAAIDSMQDEITNSLESLVIAQLGEDVILLEVAGEPTFTSRQNASDGNNDQVVVEVQAAVEVLIIDESAFLQALAEQSGSDISVTDALEVLAPESLRFEAETLEDDRLEVEVEGVVRAEYILDVEMIEEAMAGLSANEIEEVLSADESIDSYNLSISPFWKNSIPNNPDKIEVTIVGQDGPMVDLMPEDSDDPEETEEAEDQEENQEEDVQGDSEEGAESEDSVNITL